MQKKQPFPRFPLFVSLEGRAVLVVGGGTVAARRAAVLLSFGAAVTVASPRLCGELEALCPPITWREEAYRLLDGDYALIVAATDDRAVNRRVGVEAGLAGIPVSVADSREESTFWFPAIIRHEKLVAGVVSVDGDHAAVKKAAGIIRAGMGEA